MFLFGLFVFSHEEHCLDRGILLRIGIRVIKGFLAITRME